MKTRMKRTGPQIRKSHRQWYRDFMANFRAALVKGVRHSDTRQWKRFQARKAAS